MVQIGSIDFDPDDEHFACIDALRFVTKNQIPVTYCGLNHMDADFKVECISDNTISTMYFKRT